MQRFRPALPPITLSNKVKSHLEEQRYMLPKERARAYQVAGAMGMDADARSALARLIALASTRKIGVAGRFMPDDGVSALLAAQGIAENVEEEDFFRFRSVITPYGGISSKQRREWEEEGYPLEDFTAPQVRRAQVALGLLRMEGAQGLVIGRHDDPETLALTGGGQGTRVIEDTTDTARLAYSPAFGVVCQTTLSPRKVAWLVEQLRFRYRDARVTFLDTLCQSMNVRVEALEKLLVRCEHAIVVGNPGEASCEALAETAIRRGRTVSIVAKPQDLVLAALKPSAAIALTAGAFATDEAVQAVARALVSC